MKHNRILSFSILILITIFANVLNVGAAVPSKLGPIEQVGDRVMDSCGKESCYGMALKVSGSTATICTDYDKDSPARGNATCTLTSDWSEKVRYGVAAIINEAKSGISTSKMTTEYFAAEMAINRFLHNKSAGGSDIAGTGLSSTYRSTYIKYLDLANEAYDKYSSDSKVDIKLSTSSLTFTLSGNNYVSNKITVSGVDSYSVSTNVGTVSKSGSSFTVSVPKSSVTSKTSVTVTVTSSKSLNQARNYDCGSDYQTITPVILESVTKSDSIKASGNILPKAKLTIKKVDSNNQQLSGAKITVTGPNGYSKSFTTTTTSVVLEDLEYGTYTIKETEAPSGYSIAKEVTATLSESNLSQTVTMTDTLKKVSISKVDITGENEIPGATLEIQDASGNIVKYCTDDKGNKNTECKWISTDKAYEIEGLPNGKYYLVETIAPSGYVLSKEKIEFEITDNDVTKTVKMENKLNHVNIKKVSAVDGKLLSGATLQIVDKEGNIVKYCTDDKGNKNTECKWVSTKEAYKIEGLPNGIYYLMEVKSPEGYVLNKDKVEFVVDGNKDIVEVEMKNQLEVKVPDTLSSKSALLLAIAMFDIALGIGIITYVKKNKIQE